MLAYIDTSVWIALVEGLPAYQIVVEQYLDLLKSQGWAFSASQAVLMECLYKPYREQNQNKIATYTSLFGQTKILPNYTDLFNDGMGLLKKESLKAMDTLHVAIAFHYGCTGFITTDKDFSHLKTVPLYFIDLSQIKTR